MKQLYDKIANEMKFDFKGGYLHDYFDTEYCITEDTLDEYTTEEIECCMLDWVHSIKEEFLSKVINELHPGNEDECVYYEQYYDDCYTYLLNRVFEREEN